MTVSQHSCLLKLLVLCQCGHSSVGLVVLPHYPGTCYLKCMKVLPSFKELVSERAKRDTIRSIKGKYDST